MPPSPALVEKAVNTIRMLAADAVQQANSGHPGMPMGAADLAHVLWTRHLRFDPKDPRWVGRDRFVLSGGHGSMLLYALLHLAAWAAAVRYVNRISMPRAARCNAMLRPRPRLPPVMSAIGVFSGLAMVVSSYCVSFSCTRQ